MNEKYNGIINRAIRPIGITTLISLLWQFLRLNMLSDPSLTFFYCFIFLYVANFTIDFVLSSRNASIEEFKRIGVKHVQLLPVKFVEVAGLALIMFAPQEVSLWLTLKILLVVIACEIGLEGYHKFIIPRLNKMKVTPQLATLTVVGMTVTLFFYGMYYLVLSEHHLVFIQ